MNRAQNQPHKPSPPNPTGTGPTHRDWPNPPGLAQPTGTGLRNIWCEYYP
jgi:hypothetical protein